MVRESWEASNYNEFTLQQRSCKTLKNNFTSFHELTRIKPKSLIQVTVSFSVKLNCQFQGILTYLNLFDMGKDHFDLSKTSAFKNIIK